MKNKKIILFISLIMFCFSFVGCASKSEANFTTAFKSSSNDSFATDSVDMGSTYGANPIEAPEEIYDFKQENGVVSAQTTAKEVETSVKPDKVITTVNMSIETTEFEKSIKNLNNLINENDAYVEQSQINNGAYDYYVSEDYRNVSYKYATYTIRIPKNNYEKFIGNINNIGFVKNENKTTEDVTSYYEDTQSRLKVLEVKEERILNLLDKAEFIEDIITLENTLNQVIYEEESLMKSLRGLDNKVEFTTLYLQINEVSDITTPETIKTSFGTKIKNALNETFNNFVDGLQELIIGLVYLLPLVVCILVIGIILIVTFKIKRSKKTKKNDIKTNSSDEDNK